MDDVVERLFPSGSMCLAPMVRCGTLPLRLLSLRYGAAAVYVEELIDRKAMAMVRVPSTSVLDVEGCVDYRSTSGGGLVFRTCNEERERVIFQLGSADATRALRAAQIVERDVAAVDLNMGCPKHFSVSGGMGAALLTNLPVATDIIKTLRRNLSVPVTCKVRLLENDKDMLRSIDLLRSLEGAGAMAIAVHARQVHERFEPAHWDRLDPLVRSVSVPVIANGDVYDHQGACDLIEQSGCRSVMVARGALHNASIFRPKALGMLPRAQVVSEFAQVALECDNSFKNTKYTTLRMATMRDAAGKSPSHELKFEGDTEGLGQFTTSVEALTSTKSVEDLYDCFGRHAREKLDAMTAARAKAREDAVAAAVAEVTASNAAARAKAQLRGCPSATELQAPVLWCELCGVKLSSEAERPLHERGRKHRRKLREALEASALRQADQVRCVEIGATKAEFSVAQQRRGEANIVPSVCAGSVTQPPSKRQCVSQMSSASVLEPQ
eukprot:g1290.t1